MKLVAHCILLTLTIFCLVSVSSQRKTLQLIVLANGGPRFPLKGHISKYIKSKADQYNIPENSDNKLRGKLTGNGMRMDYLLGKNISNIFADFIATEIASIGDIYAVSSSSPYNSMSVQNLLKGLLETNTGSQPFTPFGNYSLPPFPGNTPDNSGVSTSLPNGYYPLPITILSETRSKLFAPHLPQNCKRFDQFGAKRKDLRKRYLEEINDIIRNFPILQTLVREIKENHNLSHPFITSSSEAEDLLAYLRSMQSLGENFGIKSHTFYYLLLSQNILSSQQYFEDQGLKVMLTPLLSNMKEKIAQMLHSQSKPQDKLPYPKVLLYLGEDLNIWAFLQMIGMSSTSCLEDIFNMKLFPNCYSLPNDGSSLVLQVYETKIDKEIRIDIVYNGQRMDSQTNNFKFNMNYKFFHRKFFDHFIMEKTQFDFICNNKNTYISMKLFCGFIGLVVISIMMIYLVINQIKKISKFA